MEFSFLGPDPVETQVREVLTRLTKGEAPSRIETTQVDIKEEPGRRDNAGQTKEASEQNEGAAEYFAEEMACMANTPGGGALIVGIADDGTPIGTGLNAEWLRHRIWELTQRLLTVSVQPAELLDVRILVLSTPEAIEPIRYRNRLKWRVAANCVEIDSTTWHARRLERTGFDWSAQPSNHTVDHISPVAAEIARRYLLEDKTPSTQELADAPTRELVQRLNLIGGDGQLTHAGALLFVATPGDGLDYIRRETEAGDSTIRIKGEGRPLIEQLYNAEQAADPYNRVTHVPMGLAHSQFRALPPRAIREAMVNGVIHRDWHTPEATTVEHVGDTFRVISPGDLIGGVTPDNIITHPAVSRYRSLAEAVAALRIAEREGIGIDRMYADMLAIGRPPPVISQVEGPYVRVSLLGGEPDAATTKLLASFEPLEMSHDLATLLLIDLLCQYGWVDANLAAPRLQRPASEAAAAISQMAETTAADNPLIMPVAGVPRDHIRAYRTTKVFQTALSHRMEHLQTPEGREGLILHWAQHRGRISSTEAADIAGVTTSYASRLLVSLAEDGHLEASRSNKTGRGYHYLPN